MLCISHLRCNNGSEMYSLACPLLLGSGSSRPLRFQSSRHGSAEGECGPARRRVLGSIIMMC